MLRHLATVSFTIAAALFVAGTPLAQTGGSLADALPAGKGRSLLLENCGSCHSLACPVKGQRPAARWMSLKEDHKDKVNLSDGDLDTLFAYMAENFNDKKPEPKLPPALAQQGSCTPY